MSPPPPATECPLHCLAAGGLDNCLLLPFPAGERGPGSGRGRPGDPEAPNGGRGADLLSTGSAAAATATGVRWPGVGLCSPWSLCDTQLPTGSPSSTSQCAVAPLLDAWFDLLFLGWRRRCREVTM